MRAARPASFAPRTLPTPRPVVLPRWLGLAESWALAGLVLVLTAVSGGLLWVIGVNYDGLTGSAAAKIHPATYLAVLLLGWVLARSGNPVIPAARALGVRPAAVLVAACGVALLVLIAARGGTGLAGSIDTYVLAGLVPILLVDRDAATLRRLETVFHAVMLANAVLGLVEFATGQRYFPFRMDGQAFETDTRSAALQGHPLGNATMTACYVLALAAGGGRLTQPRRAGMIALQLTALVTFGGRSATVATLALGGFYGVLTLDRTLRGGRIPLLGAAAACFALTFVPVMLAILWEIGFFDTLLGRFVSDGGSANARVEMLTLFEGIPWQGLLLGPDPTHVASLRRIYGLEWGIENSIAANVLSNGIVVTVALVVAVTLYLAEIARGARAGVWLPILAFVILINTFEALGGKTTMLAKFALMLIVLFPALNAAPRAPSGRAR